MKPLRVAVGEVVRELRKSKSMSQEKLAQRAKISRTFAGEIERGEKSMTLDALEGIAKALQVEPFELLRRARHE
jgi:transcriptional regulator with XRE-family HTH domain